MLASRQLSCGCVHRSEEDHDAHAPSLGPTIPRHFRKFQPRFGFEWRPLPATPLVIRGGNSNGDKATIITSGSTPTQTGYAPAFSIGIIFNSNLSKALFRAADSPALFDKSKPSPLPEAALKPGRIVDPLRHNSLRLKRAGLIQELWGRMWDARKLQVPLPFEQRDEPAPLQAFIGIDSAIFRFIRDRDFSSLLNYETNDEGLWEVRGESFRAVFQVDSYGIITGVYEGSLPINVGANQT